VIAKAAGVRLVNISKSYGAVRAVDDISLHVQPSEFLTILGPSGSGKTTTLMMVAGFVLPSTGEIFIGEEPVTNEPPYRRNLGVVFQSYALFPHLSVEGNVAFPLRMRRLPGSAIRPRVREVLDLVRLSEFRDRRPRELSGGQQQRVALARAIVFDPPVLLMDEPLGALDRLLRDQMQAEIKHIQRSLSKTVIYVTHDQEEALTVSDRVAVINRGRLEQIGTPREIYEAPRTEFVARFLGESNVFDAQVAGPPDERGLPVFVGDRVLWVVAVQENYVRESKVRIMVRPESVLVQHLDSTVTDADTWLGTVEAIVYQGKQRKLTVAVPGLGSLEALELARMGGAQKGDRVKVGWRPSDWRILRGSN
jgi:spermidine/putrescine ABC transporter ATP-binding subunit